MTPVTPVTSMTPTFRRTAAGFAALTATAGLVYTVTFAIFVREGSQWAQWASSVALLVGALLSLPVVLALYTILRGQEPQFAQIGLVVGMFGAIGAATHGAFDVAVLANPVPGTIELPNQVDPRGFATFVMTGLALAIFGALILRFGGLPRATGFLAVAGSACLLVVYLGRLIALDPNTAAVKPFALLYGMIIGPAFYLLVARALWSAPTPDTTTTTTSAPATTPAAQAVRTPAPGTAPASSEPISAPASRAVRASAPSASPAPGGKAGHAPEDDSVAETFILPDRDRPAGQHTRTVKH